MMMGSAWPIWENADFCSPSIVIGDPAVNKRQPYVMVNHQLLLFELVQQMVVY